MQVLIRGSEGVSTALQAVARARNTLNKLYELDCVVYMAWKSPPPAAAAAAAASDVAPSGISSSTAHSDHSNSSHTDHTSSTVPLEGHQHQAAATVEPAELPNRLYKLVVMSCDMSDPLSGWKHLGPDRRAHQVQEQQAWLLQAQQRQQERQQQRRQQARMKRPRWYRPRRKPQVPQEPPS